MAPYSRRRFIRESALLSSGLFFSSFAPTRFFIGKKPKVIIIGAGFAGLHAAWHLKQNGCEVMVLEARKSVGGRVFSHTIDEKEKLVIELGAEWIGEDHTIMRGLCDHFGLKTFNNQFETRLIYKDKFYNNYEEPVTAGWKDRYEALLNNYRNMSDDEKAAYGEKIDRMDWWRYLVNNGCSGTDLDIRELADSTDFGESIRHVSAYGALDEYAKNGEKTYNQMDYKIAGGNQQLAFALQKRLGDIIRFNTTVSKVVQKDKVQVYCSDGYMVEADKLICTAPTYAVGQIDWQPALPETMTEAMNALQYCRINKNALLYSKRFWKDEAFDMVTDMPAHYFYHATKSQRSTKGVLISYTIGDKAAVVANQSDEWKAEMVSRSLKAGFGDTRHLIEKQANYYWGNDGRSHGAYAFYGIGQWTDVFPALAPPHMHTHFAGEHVSETWQGFMEGALETGKAAAEAILA